MNIRDIGRDVGATIAENVGRAAGRVQEATPLPADVLESDDAYLVVFDAPGATASDVQVRYEDGEVLVRVDRFREFREGFEMRLPGRGLALDGTVDLPENALVDADAATATLRDDGTLEVRVPKRGGVIDVEEDDDGEIVGHDEDADDDIDDGADDSDNGVNDSDE